jgi:hypothetical protein
MLRVELERKDSPRAKKEVFKDICTVEAPAFYWRSTGLHVAALTGKGILTALLPGSWGASSMFTLINEEDIELGKRKVLTGPGYSLEIYRAPQKSKK